ncbi:MAG: DUF493 domain-containing protein [Flavobacteriaceae bacterium]|nr:MAG: DUF493 domain-containing protein [Flavobacteriaceae bacterium]
MSLKFVPDPSAWFKDRIFIFVQNTNLNQEDQFYQKLQTQLDESKDLPGKYIYKFIFPNLHSNQQDLQKVFVDFHPIYTQKVSKNAKYLSLTVTIYANSSSQVIDLYKKASKIKGIIML